MVGETPSTQDIKTFITADNAHVNVLSLLGVFLVVMFSFRSVLVPVIVMIPIQVAIFLNMAVPYLTGSTMVYMGYIIVSSIQLGATVDYSILLTNNYMACRKEMKKKGGLPPGCENVLRLHLYIGNYFDTGGLHHSFHIKYGGNR